MIILTGPSASGKTEVAKILRQNHEMIKVITTTTRPMRVGEINDIDYHFVSKTQFEQLMKEEAFIETTVYNENYYGTFKSEIGPDKVLIVDPNGIKKFLALNDPKNIIFLLEAEKVTRFNRMIYRGDEITNINRRLENDLVTFSKEELPFVNFVIPTDKQTIVEVSETIYQIYLKELSKLN